MFILHKIIADDVSFETFFYPRVNYSAHDWHPGQRVSMCKIHVYNTIIQVRKQYSIQLRIKLLMSFDYYVAWRGELVMVTPLYYYYTAAVHP